MYATTDLSLPPLHRAWRAAALRHDEARFQHHLLAVLLVAQGQSCSQVGTWLACSPRSIERWVNAYRCGGCDALRVLRAGGRPARLTALQWSHLSADLVAPPSVQGFAHSRWCGKLLATHLSRRYGLEFSLRQCQRMLDQWRRQHARHKAGRQGIRRFADGALAG